MRDGGVKRREKGEGERERERGKGGKKEGRKKLSQFSKKKIEKIQSTTFIV